MTGAIGVLAIGQVTAIAGESPRADALAVGASTVAGAVGGFALVVAQVTLGAFPAREAATSAVLVIAVAGAQHGTHTCDVKQTFGRD